jgi:hypothetical protein
VTDPEPHFGRIHRTDRDLPLTRELDTHELLAVHRDVDAFARYLRIRLLECVIAVAARYELSRSALESALAAERAAHS